MPALTYAVVVPPDPITEVRSQLRDAELAVIHMNIQLMIRRSAELPSGDVEAEIHEITEARDFIRARLTRLEGEQPHGRR